MSDDTDIGKPTYKAADDRTPQKREQELIDGEIAEGREKPADGSRPLSTAAPKVGKQEGGFRHILRTGLPPGIEVEEAIDPGSQHSQTPAKNRS